MIFVNALLCFTLLSLLMGRKSKRASSPKRIMENQIDCEDLRDAMFVSPSFRSSSSKGKAVVDTEVTTGVSSLPDSGKVACADHAEGVNPTSTLPHCDEPHGAASGPNGQVGDDNKPWSSLFAMNRERTSQCSLRYVPPSLNNGVQVAKFNRAEVCSEESK